MCLQHLTASSKFIIFTPPIFQPSVQGLAYNYNFTAHNKIITFPPLNKIIAPLPSIWVKSWLYKDPKDTSGCNIEYTFRRSYHVFIRRSPALHVYLKITSCSQTHFNWFLFNPNTLKCCIAEETGQINKLQMPACLSPPAGGFLAVSLNWMDWFVSYGIKREILLLLW